MEIRYYSTNESVACDNLMENGFVLEILDHKGALRRWILSIRGKIKGTITSRNNTSGRVDWSINSGTINCWLLALDTERLFRQIAIEIEKGVIATMPWSGITARPPLRLADEDSASNFTAAANFLYREYNAH